MLCAQDVSQASTRPPSHRRARLAVSEIHSQSQALRDLALRTSRRGRLATASWSCPASEKDSIKSRLGNSKVGRTQLDISRRRCNTAIRTI